MPEPVSITMICILGVMLILTIWTHFEPRYDAWQRERTARSRRRPNMILSLSVNFAECIAIARILTAKLEEPDWKAITTLPLKVAGRNEILMVPGSSYKIPIQWQLILGNNRSKNINFIIQTDTINRGTVDSDLQVVGFRIFNINSDGTVGEIRKYIQSLNEEVPVPISQERL